MRAEMHRLAVSLVLYISMTDIVPITVAHGDGIGPEIMDATLRIVQEAGARIKIETIEIGEKVYLRGNRCGDRAERLGVAAADESLSESADHDSAGRGIQEPERDDAEDAGALRQRAAVRGVRALCSYEASR